MRKCFAGSYLSKESPPATAFAAVKIDMDIVILAVYRFFHEWFFQQSAIHRKGIFIDHLEARDWRVLVEIHAELISVDPRSDVPF